MNVSEAFGRQASKSLKRERGEDLFWQIAVLGGAFGESGNVHDRFCLICVLILGGFWLTLVKWRLGYLGSWDTTLYDNTRRLTRMESVFWT